MNVSTNSNLAVDFCVKSNTDLTDSSSGQIIALANETYSNATSSNSGTPSFGNRVSFTTGYVKAGENVARGNSTYYRFWLYLPPATEAGTYNNTIYFAGTGTGGTCT